ncbi:MAG: hypothetical protein ACT4O6_16000 [Reyranella sp.]
MLEKYRFEDRETGESRYLDGWSYVWAALAGPLYVLRHGFLTRAIVMLVASVGILAVLVACLVILVVLLDSALVVVALATVALAAALLVQGVVAIDLVRKGYLRRGWQGWAEGW